MLRPISQKIFIILGKILETLSDKELNMKLDAVILHRIDNVKPQLALNGEKEIKPNDDDGNVSSATLTITKMVLQNTDKLLQSLMDLQKNEKSNLDGVPLIVLDEDQLDVLVKLLTNNE